MKKKYSIILVSVFITIVSVVSVYAATTIASSSVTYNNSTSGSPSTNVSGALNDLYSKVPTKFKVGDYVQMTPTKTSYVVPKTLSGYSNDQNRNPGELDIWRVIKIYDDGRVDLVSQYVSNSVVYISGLVGYQNLIGTLNYIAKQYENRKYTVGSRHMGYNAQTEYITDTTLLTSTSVPSQYSTDSMNVTITTETQGLGDLNYTTDLELVNTALGTLKVTKKGQTTNFDYWIASRYYKYNNTTSWYFSPYYIDSTGTINKYNIYSCSNSRFTSNWGNKFVRPIVTLKPRVKATSGSGTSSSPYVLS